MKQITNAKAALLVVFLSIFALGAFVVAAPTSVFAEHGCTGNADTDQERDFEEFGHACDPLGGGGDGGGGGIAGLLGQMNGILNTIIPFLVGLAVFIIIWGVFKYLSGAGDEEQRAEAKQFIIWGVIGVFFMVSIWGFVNILVNSFDLKKDPVPVTAVFPNSAE